MKRAAILAGLLGVLSASAFAADWTEYKIGPFRVYSDAGDGDARARLTEMEQLRWVLGGWLGKDPLRNEQLETMFPIAVVLFDSDREAASYIPPKPFVEGGDKNLSAGKGGGKPSVEWRHEVARQLLEDNSGGMPEEIETAVADLLSTIEVKTTRVAIGAPVPGLSGARLRTWARLHMLATQPEYAGRFRVYLRNLEGGDPQLAARNTYGVEATELDRRMDAYVSTGKFVAADVFGKPINPQKEFYERRMTQPEVDAILAELKAAGTHFPPDSPRGRLATNTRDSLYAAIGDYPTWAAPHAALAALMPDPKSRIAPLQNAVKLDPRNSAYWEALARAQTGAELYLDASKSWIQAEKTASTDTERTRIRKERAAIEEQRVEAELAVKRAARDAAERELRRVIEESDARVHAAELAANRANALQSGPSTGATPVAFNEAYTGTRVAGRLTEVQCVDNILKLVIQVPNSANAVVLVRANPVKDGQPVFTCGPVDPPRRIEVVHNAKADSRWNTVGEVDTYDLR